MATVTHNVTEWEVGAATLKFGDFDLPCVAVYVTCDNNTWNDSDYGNLKIPNAQASLIAAAIRTSSIVTCCGLSCKPENFWGGVLATGYIYGDNDLSIYSTSYSASNVARVNYDVKCGSMWLSHQVNWATVGDSNTLCYTVDPIYIDKATNRVIAGTVTNFHIYTYPINAPAHTLVCDGKIPCISCAILASGGTSGDYLQSETVISNGKLLSVDIDPTPTPITNDPYGPGGDSDDDPTGGDGDFDGTSEPIAIPGLPTLSAVDSGFITIFNPSVAQLISLCSYMWSGAFDLSTFIKLFADPMDCILGLSIVPVSIPNGGSKVVKVGNISTGITMTVAATQYVVVDCGSINVNEYWGAYLDYDPYTKAEIYLPYIGTHALSMDDIMGKTVKVEYHVDILSGACTAFVKCGDSVLYTFIGQCTSSIPISGNDWTNVINGVLSIAGSVGSMMATGGATAPLAVPTLASTAVNGMKPNIEKSGSISGTGGLLGIQTPYLILTRPRQALPRNQNTFTGYPTFITRKLSDVSGYTEIESVHLENISATEQEPTENP